jgi:hypothetical protein
VRELQSIADFERYTPSIDSIFGPTAAYYYWSSSTDAFDTSTVWYVLFSDDHDDDFPKSTVLNARASGVVRSRTCEALHRGRNRAP